jgi:hypothetical protein
MEPNKEEHRSLSELGDNFFNNLFTNHKEKILNRLKLCWTLEDVKKLIKQLENEINIERGNN